MKRKGNEAHESAGFVLQASQFHQVVDAVLGRLDVSIEHRGVGVNSALVDLTREFEPARTGGLVGADAAPGRFVEYFGASSRTAIEARGYQPVDDLIIG